MFHHYIILLWSKLLTYTQMEISLSHEVKVCTFTVLVCSNFYNASDSFAAFAYRIQLVNRYTMDKPNTKKSSAVDLSRFGLAADDTQNSINDVEFMGCGAGGYRPTSRNELFAGEEVCLNEYVVVSF